MRLTGSAARTLGVALVAGLSVLVTPLARADEPSFMDLIRAGEYRKLARSLRANIDLDRADPDLRWYLEKNLEYLERGAEPAQPGNEIILIRGGRNDKPYNMPAASGGEVALLPNTIRYRRQPWNKRLRAINSYFTYASSAAGGDGAVSHELGRIMTHHRGGGLATNANSVKSVLISASVKPLPIFGPPFYILKVPAERAIFNYNGLSGEAEVLLPFWVLPKEVVAVCETLEEAKNHPLYKESALKDLQAKTWGLNPVDNWKIIESNIREGRPLLDGVAGLNLYLPGGRSVGRNAEVSEISRFVEKVRRHGGDVERVLPGDPRLPKGVLGRTYLDAEGRPRVLIPGGAVKHVALIEELTHVIQLRQEVDANGAGATHRLLLAASRGEPEAVRRVVEWELRARRFVLGSLGADHPARAAVITSIRDLEAERLEPGSRAARELGRLTLPELLTRAWARGEKVSFTEMFDKTAMVSRLSGAERSLVERRIADVRLEARASTAAAPRGSRSVLDRARENVEGYLERLRRGIRSRGPRGRSRGR